MRAYSRRLKSLSLLLIAALLAEQVAFAAPEFKPSENQLFEKPSVDLRFPESIATVEDAWNAGAGSRTVYLFQDAHANHSGQTNLSRSLDHLLEREADLRWIFIEGGSGDNSLSFLRASASADHRRAVADRYLRKGLLHGEEHLDLSSDRDMAVWGVEDLSLYIEAVAAYKKTAAERERFQTYLASVDAAAQSLKSAVFNPRLLALDRELRRYAKNEIAVTDYAQTLLSASADAGVSAKDFQHLRLFSKLRDREAKLDFKQAAKEQQKAVAGLSESDRKELSEMTESAARSPFKISGEDKEGRAAFYSALREKIGSHLEEFPEFYEYLAYLEEAKTIQAENVLEELAGLEERTLTALSWSGDEADLLRASKIASMYRKLFALQMTPEEYQEYRKLSVSFGIERATGFLNKKIVTLGVATDRALLLEKGFEDIVENAEKFYDLTLSRDEAMIKQALDKMEAENASKAALIAGGFHAQNLKALLKSKKISYISIRPQVFHETNQKRYETELFGRTIRPDLQLMNPSLSTARGLAVVTANAREVMDSWRTEFSNKTVFEGSRQRRGSRLALLSPADSLENPEKVIEPKPASGGARLSFPIRIAPKSTTVLENMAVRSVEASSLAGSRLADEKIDRRNFLSAAAMLALLPATLFSQQTPPKAEVKVDASFDVSPYGAAGTSVRVRFKKPYTAAAETQIGFRVANLQTRARGVSFGYLLSRNGQDRRTFEAELLEGVGVVKMAIHIPQGTTVYGFIIQTPNGFKKNQIREAYLREMFAPEIQGSAISNPQFRPADLRVTTEHVFAASRSSVRVRMAAVERSWLVGDVLEIQFGSAANRLRGKDVSYTMVWRGFSPDTTRWAGSRPFYFEKTGNVASDGILLVPFPDELKGVVPSRRLFSRVELLVEVPGVALPNAAVQSHLPTRVRLLEQTGTGARMTQVSRRSIIQGVGAAAVLPALEPVAQAVVPEPGTPAHLQAVWAIMQEIRPIETNLGLLALHSYDQEGVSGVDPRVPEITHRFIQGFYQTYDISLAAITYLRKGEQEDLGKAKHLIDYLLQVHKDGILKVPRASNKEHVIRTGEVNVYGLALQQLVTLLPDLAESDRYREALKDVDAYLLSMSDRSEMGFAVIRGQVGESWVSMEHQITGTMYLTMRYAALKSAVGEIHTDTVAVNSLRERIASWIVRDYRNRGEKLLRGRNDDNFASDVSFWGVIALLNLKKYDPLFYEKTGLDKINLRRLLLEAENRAMKTNYEFKKFFGGNFETVVLPVVFFFGETGVSTPSISWSVMALRAYEALWESYDDGEKSNNPDVKKMIDDLRKTIELASITDDEGRRQGVPYAEPGRTFADGWDATGYRSVEGTFWTWMRSLSLGSFVPFAEDKPVSIIKPITPLPPPVAQESRILGTENSMGRSLTNPAKSKWIDFPGDLSQVERFEFEDVTVVDRFTGQPVDNPQQLKFVIRILPRNGSYESPIWLNATPLNAPAQGGTLTLLMSTYLRGDILSLDALTPELLRDPKQMSFHFGTDAWGYVQLNSGALANAELRIGRVRVVYKAGVKAPTSQRQAVEEERNIFNRMETVHAAEQNFTSRVSGGKLESGHIRLTGSLPNFEEFKTWDLTNPENRRKTGLREEALEMLGYGAGARMATNTDAPARINKIASLIETREIPREHYQGDWYQIAYETAGSRRHMDKNIIARHMVGFLEMVKNDDTSRYALKKRWEEDQELIIAYDSRPGQAEDARFMASIAVAQGFKVRLVDKSMPTPVAAEMSRKGKPVIASIVLTASHVALKRNQKDAFGNKLSDEEYVTGFKFFVDNAPQPDVLGKAIEGPANDASLNQYPMIPLDKLEQVTADRLTIVTDTSEIYRESRERMWKAFGGESFKHKALTYLQSHPNFMLHYSSIHGAMGDYAPAVFEMFGIRYTHYDKQAMDEVTRDETLRQSLEGKRQNPAGDWEYWKPDPTQVQNWSEEWKAAVVGALADDFFGMNDGDGDRLDAMEAGMQPGELNPNRIGLIALDHLSRRLGQDGAVSRTVPTSRGLDAHRRAMRKSPPNIVPVGSRNFPYEDDLLDVEESGHMNFSLNGEFFVDNGVANLLLLLDAMFTTDSKPRDLLVEAWQFIERETGVKELFQKRLSITQKEVTPSFQDFVVWLRTEGIAQKASREAIVREIAGGLGKTLHPDSPISTVDILGLGFAFSDETGGTLRNSGTELLTRNYVEYAKGENPDQQAARAEQTLLKFYRENWLNPLTDQVLKVAGSVLSQSDIASGTAIPPSERWAIAKAVEARYEITDIPAFESNRWETPADIVPYVSRRLRLNAGSRFAEVARINRSELSENKSFAALLQALKPMRVDAVASLDGDEIVFRPADMNDQNSDNPRVRLLNQADLYVVPSPSSAVHPLRQELTRAFQSYNQFKGQLKEQFREQLDQTLSNAAYDGYFQIEMDQQVLEYRGDNFGEIWDAAQAAFPALLFQVSPYNPNTKTVVIVDNGAGLTQVGDILIDPGQKVARITIVGGPEERGHLWGRLFNYQIPKQYPFAAVDEILKQNTQHVLSNAGKVVPRTFAQDLQIGEHIILKDRQVVYRVTSIDNTQGMILLEQWSLPQTSPAAGSAEDIGYHHVPNTRGVLFSPGARLADPKQNQSIGFVSLPDKIVPIAEKWLSERVKSGRGDSVFNTHDLITHIRRGNFKGLPKPWGRQGLQEAIDRLVEHGLIERTSQTTETGGIVYQITLTGKDYFGAQAGSRLSVSAAPADLAGRIQDPQFTVIAEDLALRATIEADAKLLDQLKDLLAILYESHMGLLNGERAPYGDSVYSISQKGVAYVLTLEGKEILTVDDIQAALARYRSRAKSGETSAVSALAGAERLALKRLQEARAGASQISSQAIVGIPMKNLLEQSEEGGIDKFEALLDYHLRNARMSPGRLFVQDEQLLEGDANYERRTIFNAAMMQYSKDRPGSHTLQVAENEAVTYVYLTDASTINSQRPKLAENEAVVMVLISSTEVPFLAGGYYTAGLLSTVLSRHMKNGQLQKNAALFKDIEQSKLLSIWRGLMVDSEELGDLSPSDLVEIAKLAQVISDLTPYLLKRLTLVDDLVKALGARMATERSA